MFPERRIRKRESPLRKKARHGAGYYEKITMEVENP